MKLFKSNIVIGVPSSHFWSGLKIKSFKMKKLLYFILVVLTISSCTTHGTFCPKELKKLKRKNKEKKIFLTISFCLHKNRCLVTRKPFIYQKIMTKGMFKSKNLATNEPV